MKISIVIMFAIYLVLFFISKCLEVKQLKTENQSLKNDVALNKCILEQYKHQLLLLRQINANMGNQKIYSNVSQDTVEAVKCAMKHAHPDNGGNAEDFIKFKKCYEELTRD